MICYLIFILFLSLYFRIRHENVIQLNLSSFRPTHILVSRFLADPESVQRSLDPRIADVLFILTITNSVVNPYVYGSYASEMRWEKGNQLEIKAHLSSCPPLIQIQVLEVVRLPWMQKQQRCRRQWRRRRRRGQRRRRRRRVRQWLRRRPGQPQHLRTGRLQLQRKHQRGQG